MVSWQVPHLSTGSRPDFNNGLGAYSNSGPVLGPGIYLSLTRIMTPPWATPILCQMKYTSVQVSCLRFPGGYYIWPDFTNGPGNDLNSTRSLARRRLFETDVNNDPPQAIPNPVSDGEYMCSGLLFWWVPNSSAVSLFLFNPSSQTVQHFCKEHNQMLKVVLLQVAFYVKA